MTIINNRCLERVHGVIVLAFIAHMVLMWMPFSQARYPDVAWLSMGKASTIRMSSYWGWENRSDGVPMVLGFLTAGVSALGLVRICSVWEAYKTVPQLTALQDVGIASFAA